MYVGIILLATASLIAAVIADAYLKLLSKSTRFAALDRAFKKVLVAGDSTSLVSAIAGVIFILPDKQNQATLYLLALWVLFIAVRLRYGETLWSSAPLVAVQTLTVVFGAFALAEFAMKEPLTVLVIIVVLAVLLVRWAMKPKPDMRKLIEKELVEQMSEEVEGELKKIFKGRAVKAGDTNEGNQ